MAQGAGDKQWPHTFGLIVAVFEAAPPLVLGAYFDNLAIVVNARVDLLLQDRILAVPGVTRVHQTRPTNGSNIAGHVTRGESCAAHSAR